MSVLNAAERGDSIQLSVVLPCLNEEKTIAGCIEEIRRSLDPHDVSYEILVADNGSTDQSAVIAERLGAEVIQVPERGYGAAIQGGIAAARGEYVIFVDADETYLLHQTYRLFQETRTRGASMGLACRLTRDIEKGAMPFLHRYLGTPVLSSLINLFFGGRVRDCNSGFRCIHKGAYESWQVHAPGMEFASELLIKAMKARARIIEIPSGLRRGHPDREAHLRTWRDGMRHLLFIISEKPQVFEISGFVLVCVATVLQMAAAIMGPTRVMGFNIFSPHSQALLLAAALTGLQFYLFACYIYLGGRECPLKVTQRLINLDEGVLFFILLACLFGEAAAFLMTFIVWAEAHFTGIYVIHRLLPTMHLLLLPMVTSVGLAGVHAFKRNALFRRRVFPGERSDRLPNRRTTPPSA